MHQKILKTFLKQGTKYFVFVFIAVFLSLFSYMFSLNMTFSLQEYLSDQVKPLLWWDIVLSSQKPIDIDLDTDYPNVFISSESVEFDSTLFIDGNPKLYEFLYFGENFPLYDTFQYQTINTDLWVILNQETYDYFGESIDVFGKKLPISGIISEEPLWEFSLYTTPKIYIPAIHIPADVDETNSRVLYKKYYRFTADYNWALAEEIKEKYRQDGLRITSLSDRNETIGNITDRLYLFIHVFNISIILLSFFVILISMETFFKKITSKIGLLHVLGMSKWYILWLVCLSIIGVFLGAFLLAFLGNIFAFEYMWNAYDFFGFYPQTFWIWISIMIVLLCVWISIPVYKIYESPIWVLLKNSSDFSRFNTVTSMIYLCLFLLGFVVISFISGISFLTSLIYGFIGILLLVFWYFSITAWLRWCYQIIQKYRTNFYIFDALRSTIKPGNISFLVVFLSIVSSLALFIFFVFSGSFLTYLSGLISWGNNMFIVNIQQNDRENLSTYFDDEQVFEIINARIDQINGQNLAEFLWTDRVSRRFSREFFSTTYNLNDPLVSGRPLESGGLSVDAEFAKTLWIQLWDTIVLNIAGLKKELTIINTRRTEQNGTQPFFYFQLDSADFERYPKTYFASYKQSDYADDFDTQLQQSTISQLTFIDIKSITELLQGVANNIILIVYICMWYIIIFCVMSFLSSIEFLSQFKQKKMTILSTLWWDKKSLQQAGRIEYMYLVAIGFLFSWVFGVLSIGVLFYFIDFFTLASIYLYIASSIWIMWIIWTVGMIYYHYNKKDSSTEL